LFDDIYWMVSLVWWNDMADCAQTM